MNTTIKSLRQSGYKVRVLHDRYIDVNNTPFKALPLNYKQLTHASEAKKSTTLAISDGLPKRCIGERAIMPSKTSGISFNG